MHSGLQNLMYLKTLQKNMMVNKVIIGIEIEQQVAVRRNNVS